MAKWLDKINPSSGRGGNNLPMKSSGNVPSMGGGRAPEQPRALPNASIVYGIAACLLFAMALYHFFTGRWFTGILVLLPAGCFLGFAWHFAKHAR